MNKLVIIGIPIYKMTLNELEKISLQQVVRILGRYPITFIVPESLLFNYGQEFSKFKVERFPDKYFQNTSSYSQLLLTKEFYERFYEYEFLLIYQLDAFVFSDRLEEFCQLNFDYIGAPVPKCCWPPDMEGYVGNGGFSLRKIKSVIRILKMKENISIDPFLESQFNKAEDIFFAYCGTKQEFQFKVPSVRQAMNFSMEYDVYHCFRTLTIKLPFGCHGWYKTNFAVWKPLIEKYGYQLNDSSGENNGPLLIKQIKRRPLQKYLANRIIRENKEEYFKSVLANVIDIKIAYRIWGAGEDGKRCLDLLRVANVKIDCIYDKGKIALKSLAGISIKNPSDNEVKKGKSIIIVASKYYELEIAEYLKKMGLKKNIDFLFFDEMEEIVTKEYYEKIAVKYRWKKDIG